MLGLFVGVAAGSALIFGGLGLYIADQRGRSMLEGAIFGVLLGPIGLLIEAVMPTR